MRAGTFLGKVGVPSAPPRGRGVDTVLEPLWFIAVARDEQAVQAAVAAANSRIEALRV